MGTKTLKLELLQLFYVIQKEEFTTKSPAENTQKEMLIFLGKIWTTKQT